MSDYTQTTFFAPKDSLITGDADKIIKGSELDPELSAISTAIATKYDNTDLASQAEAEAGTSTTKLMTPARVEDFLTYSGATFSITTTGTFNGRDVDTDGTKLDGIASGAEVNPAVVSQAEAEAGTATNERIWTAERVAQAIAALADGRISVAATLNTTTFTATANSMNKTDTTSAAFTATLPATPSVGDQVQFLDIGASWGTNNLTIGRNGEPIHSTADDMTLTVDSLNPTFTYLDATRGWWITSSS